MYIYCMYTVYQNKDLLLRIVSFYFPVNDNYRNILCHTRIFI